LQNNAPSTAHAPPTVCAVGEEKGTTEEKNMEKATAVALGEDVVTTKRKSMEKDTATALGVGKMAKATVPSSKGTAPIANALDDYLDTLQWQSKPPSAAKATVPSSKGTVPMQMPWMIILIH
jgi:hypothetical protein